MMPETLLRSPQPLGIFPLPAGYLLLPAPVSDTETDGETESVAAAAVSALLRGSIPAVWPNNWEFYAMTLQGDTDAAYALLESDPSPAAAYNRYVLRPDTESLAEMASRLPKDVCLLAEIAAYCLGLRESPPAVGDLTGEFLAHAFSAHAAYALERDDPVDAASRLEAAITAARPVSPIFTAQLLAQLASVLRMLPPDGPENLSTSGESRPVTLYREAVALAQKTPLVRLTAEFLFALGTCYQESAADADHRGGLLDAVKAYQQAIQCGLSTEQHPELYAEVHNHLGLAYMAMPAATASDQLRMLVAIQSFREALKVHSKETSPERWASLTLNLANAFQYLPSPHIADNLMQAVHLYEDVLSVRSKAADPVGYARVLTNQANALSHLGMFSPALEKLNEAYKLFQWYNEADAAATVMQLLDQISASRA